LKPALPAAAALAVLAAVSFEAISADGEEEDEPPLVMRMYRLEDLLFTRDWTSDRSAHRTWLYDVDRILMGPIVGRESDYRNPFGVSGTGLFGEAMPGPQELRDLLQRSVNHQGDPKVAAWGDEGGPASMETLLQAHTCTLVVTQTERAHTRIENLLRELRRNSVVGGPMVTIHARWLCVEEGKVPVLLGGRAGGKAPLVLDAGAVKEAGAKVAFRGATTTFDHMQTFVSSGTLRHFLTDVKPVTTEEKTWVDPTLTGAYVGGFLEVRPVLPEDGKTVLLDYLSYINWRADAEPCAVPEWIRPDDKQPAPDVALDRVALASQRLHGSVRIPLEKTVLLGLTTGPDLKEGVVYALVVDVSASEGRKP
jgi:hypothetical protein